MNFGLNYLPLEGAKVQLTYRYYDLYYSDWSPTSREYSDGDTPDRLNTWRDSCLWYSRLKCFL